MAQSLWVALRFSVLTLLLAGLAYPLALTAVAQWCFPHQANGSLITQPSGRVLGSELIGQSFSRAVYFHPRPSVNHYDASNSGGSNFGATNHKLLDRVITDAHDYARQNRTGTVPADAVTASGSGLDPDITLANALQQADRVAATRHLSRQAVVTVVEQHTVRSPWSDGPAVRVLALNQALDRLYPLPVHPHHVAG